MSQNSIDQTIINQMMDGLRTSEDNFKTLLDVDSTNLYTITEEFFVKEILQFFVNLILYKQEDAIFISSWVNKVGGPTRPASVVNTAGVEIFKVPPLYDVKRIKVNTRSNDDSSLTLTDISEKSELLGNHISKRGVDYFIEGTDMLLPNIIEDNSDNINSWIKIFYKYGILTVPYLEETASLNNDDDVPNSSGDFGDYSFVDM